MVKIALLCTSADKMGEVPTGAWLEEMAAPYLIFTEKGYSVDFVSPAGGPIPVDAGSTQGDFLTQDCKTFQADVKGTKAMGESLALASINVTDYDVLYLAGGHGTCADFYGNQAVYDAIDKMYAAGKIVAADCHGPIALVGCKKPDGTPLVKGLEVTGFTDAEEAAVGLTDKVPVLIEAEFKKLGANYKGGADWAPNVCVAGNLLTGQNPASSIMLAEAVVKALA